MWHKCLANVSTMQLVFFKIPISCILKFDKSSKAKTPRPFPLWNPYFGQYSSWPYLGHFQGSNCVVDVHEAIFFGLHLCKKLHHLFLTFCFPYVCQLVPESKKLWKFVKISCLEIFIKRTCTSFLAWNVFKHASNL